MVEDCRSPAIMPCMVLLAQDKGQDDFVQGWDPDSVCGSSGSAQLLLHTVLVRGKILVTMYITSTSILSIRRESFPARGSGCQDYHPSRRSILHQSCSRFHPQPHRSMGFPQSIRGAVLYVIIKTLVPSSATGTT